MFAYQLIVSPYILQFLRMEGKKFLILGIAYLGGIAYPLFFYEFFRYFLKQYVILDV